MMIMMINFQKGPRKFPKKSIFSGKNLLPTFIFKSFTRKFPFIHLPFTAKLWANYSILLEKSPLSNLLPVHDRI